VPRSQGCRGEGDRSGKLEDGFDNAPLTFAMSGKEDASTKSFTGYYKAL